MDLNVIELRLKMKQWHPLHEFVIIHNNLLKLVIFIFYIGVLLYVFFKNSFVQ